MIKDDILIQAKAVFKVLAISMILAYMLMSPIFSNSSSIAMSVFAYSATVGWAATSFFACQTKWPYHYFVAYLSAVFSFVAPFLCMLAVEIEMLSALGYSVLIFLFCFVAIYFLLREEG